MACDYWIVQSLIGRKHWDGPTSIYSKDVGHQKDLRKVDWMQKPYTDSHMAYYMFMVRERRKKGSSSPQN